MFHHNHHCRRMRGHRHEGHEARMFERGRGRRRRLFDSGELRLVLLKLIEEQPRHGYDLIREVENRSGGAYAPSPGMVYPLLTLLLDMGLVEETEGENARKLFAITEAGRVYLENHADVAESALAKLQTLFEMRERTDAAPVARAMQNLKAAVHNRLSAEGVDKAVILQVAGLIDQAASGIERL
jgi:DNA-binding PadR family transcriptional regulator